MTAFSSSMSAAEPASRRSLIAGTIRSCKSAFLAIAAMGMAGTLRDRWEANKASFLSARSKAADRANGHDLILD